jgi:peptidoglycan/LPS O-acetylase OafA/YrhL
MPPNTASAASTTLPAVPAPPFPLTGGAAVSVPARENNFDCLRLVLATLVIFSHSYLLTGQPENEPVARFTQGPYTLGHLAVDGFFAISGFLITQSWLGNPRLVPYLKKRVLRIYPGFIAATLFCVFIAAPLLADSMPGYFSLFSLRRFTLRLLFLQGIVVPAAVFTHLPHVGVNGSLWTIYYEFLCYLFVPVFAWLGLLARRGWVLALFLACYAAYAGLLGGLGNVIEARVGVVVQQLMFFLSGMVLYLWRDKISPSHRTGVLCLAVLAIAIVLGHPDNVTPFLIAPLVIWAAFTPLIKLHHVAKHGDFSYGIYLYAYPLQQLLVRSGMRQPVALFFAALPLTVVLAVLSWRWIEGPALRLKNAKIWNSGMTPANKAEPPLGPRP